MKKTDFTRDTRVIKQIDSIKKIAQKKRVSDVMDADGLQYVDLVMEGGGVLGLALVGYTYALEQAGIRFRSTAGASAGAINALFIQATGKPNEAKSDAMVSIVADMPMKDFQDGGWDGRVAVEGWLKGNIKKVASFLLIDDLLLRQGINPGDRFHEWVTEQLKAKKVHTWGALQKQMSSPIKGLGIFNEDGSQMERPVDAKEWQPELKVIAADVATTTKMIFPQDGELFYSDLNKANPADFVRASMSVPFFFEPYRVKALQGAAAKERWLARGYKGNIPKEGVFVDGGIISNFPISAFHNPVNVPRMPTFGVKLGIDVSDTSKANSLPSLAGGMFGIMRADADQAFIRNNPDYDQVVKNIPTGKHQWLNFDMSDKAKVDLFYRGVRAAREFLQEFDWPAYKHTRRQLLGIMHQSPL